MLSNDFVTPPAYYAVIYTPPNALRPSTGRRVSDMTVDVVTCGPSQTWVPDVDCRASISLALDIRYNYRVEWSPNLGDGLVHPLVTRIVGPVDFNHDGTLNSQDYLDFVAAFFGGGMDYNGDGASTSQDYFDFVRDWGELSRFSAS